MKTKQILLSILSVIVIVLTALAVWAQPSGETLIKPSGRPATKNSKIAMVYMVDRFDSLPDADVFTHLVYAFGKFNDDLDEVVIRYPDKLKAMVALKQQNPELKVILGFNDYRKEGFSEMTRDRKKRKSFVNSVKKTINDYGLDGIDLDWEFPTTDKGGHTAHPDDDKNYVKLAKDLRKALGKDKWISYYSNNSGRWIDHKGMLPYVTYVNVSGYNLATPREGKTMLHHSPLYPGKKTGDWCVSKVMQRHLDLGIPKEKMLMGIPFFGRGLKPFKSETSCVDFDKYDEGLQKIWAEDAQAPYYADKDGNLILGYDDERSIEAKFDFLQANDLPGVFMWHYDGDFPGHYLSKAIERMRK